MHPRHAFWNASTDASPARLRADYALLPRLAEEGMASAGKDISMGGIAGTALMFCEASGVGATLDLESIPRPADMPWATWLQAFPSYGFLLAVSPARSAHVCAAFGARAIAAAVVGRVNDSRQLVLAHAGQRAAVWDLAAEPLTGFAPGGRAA